VTISNVLASRYASEEMVKIWNAENKIILERKLWLAVLQAQKDLVCVSSGCPDNISPANDWNPTDIFVRIYSEKNKFSKSIGYRKNADSDFMLTKETGFHPRTSKLTKDMMESAGYWIPSKYNNYGSIAEYTACRENVIVMDLSSLKKFEITGKEALKVHYLIDAMIESSKKNILITMD